MINKSRNRKNGDLMIWKEGGKLYYNLDKLQQYLLENPNGCSSITEFLKDLNVNNRFFSNVEKNEGIKLSYNFNVKSNFSIHFKAEYQDYNWCYKKFITEGLSYEDMALEIGCTKRVIEKWCREKHGITGEVRRKEKTLNEIQHKLIIGSLLGDGHIDKREEQPIFIVSHAENQKDYLYWKYDILKDLCNKEPTYYPPVLRKFPNNKIYNCQATYRICTRIYDVLYKYRNMSKREIIDSLEEFSLSILMLDDGYRKASCWEVCLADISIEDREYFVDKMKVKFELDSHIVNCDNRYISFSANSSRKIDKIILNNIPNELDILQYKIINNDRIKGRDMYE